MTDVPSPAIPDRHAVADFIASRFPLVSDLEVLKAGSWSSAYGFTSGSDHLVVRFGQHPEDFAKEVVASAWTTSGLPVPEILEMGEAFDASYIVSRRHYGENLADIDAARVPAVVENLVEALAVVRTIELPGAGYGIWLAPECDAPFDSWKSFLLSARDRDETRLVNWRAKLALHPEAAAAFHRGCDALDGLVHNVPNTRRVIHADLLNNHLISADNSVSAVFDWGNAMAGDPLWDIAWITTCIPWFPAIDRDHVLATARSTFGPSCNEELLAFYEFYIQLTELPYMAYADDVVELTQTANKVSQKLAAFGL